MIRFTIVIINPTSRRFLNLNVSCRDIQVRVMFVSFPVFLVTWVPLCSLCAHTAGLLQTNFPFPSRVSPRGPPSLSQLLIATLRCWLCDCEVILKLCCRFNNSRGKSPLTNVIQVKTLSHWQLFCKVPSSCLYISEAAVFCFSSQPVSCPLAFGQQKLSER